MKRRLFYCISFLPRVRTAILHAGGGHGDQISTMLASGFLVCQLPFTNIANTTSVFAELPGPHPGCQFSNPAINTATQPLRWLRARPTRIMTQWVQQGWEGAARALLKSGATTYIPLQALEIPGTPIQGVRPTPRIPKTLGT